jgi:hypothetical protein
MKPASLKTRRSRNQIVLVLELVLAKVFSPFAQRRLCKHVVNILKNYNL